MSVLLAFAYFNISPISSYFIFLYLNRERMVLVFASTLAMRVPLCLSPSIKQLWNFFSDLQLSTLPSALLLMPRGHLAGLKDELLLLLLFFLWIIGRRTHFLNNTKKKNILLSNVKSQGRQLGLCCSPCTWHTQGVSINTYWTYQSANI